LGYLKFYSTFAILLLFSRSSFLIGSTFLKTFLSASSLFCPLLLLMRSKKFKVCRVLCRNGLLLAIYLYSNRNQIAITPCHSAEPIIEDLSGIIHRMYKIIREWIFRRSASFISWGSAMPCEASSCIYGRAMQAYTPSSIPSQAYYLAPCLGKA
jgi:hypothetical protein